MATREELELLEAEAEHLRATGAPAAEFERLRKQGWREPSAGQGNGLQPCPLDCGVCHPEWGGYRRKGRK